MTSHGIEGMFTSSLLSMGRSLTEAEAEMETYLTLYLRDELSSWHTLSRKQTLTEAQLRDYVQQNADLILRKTLSLSCQLVQKVKFNFYFLLK
jgi:transformation/transcription domain-associated protein